jgi:hypothetical protein
MAKIKAKKSDLMIKVNITSTRLVDVSQETGVRSELTSRGTITGKYRGIHWDTVEVHTNKDGTSAWSVKFIQMTNNGMLFGSGNGTGDAPNARGIAKMRGEGEIYSPSPKLAEFNGKRWVCEVDNNLLTDRAAIAVNFQ